MKTSNYAQIQGACVCIFFLLLYNAMKMVNSLSDMLFTLLLLLESVVDTEWIDVELFQPLYKITML